MSAVVPSNLEDVAEALALPDNPLASPTTLQRERVEAAKAQVKLLKGDSGLEDVKSSQVVTIHEKFSTAHAGHALVNNSKALKYPNANWEVRAAKAATPLLRRGEAKLQTS